MPCDTRLLTLNEMLTVATQREAANCKRLAECQTRCERAHAGVQAAQKSLDRAIFREAQARTAYLDWLNYLNTLAGKGSPPMREKLTGLFGANARAALDTLSAREAVSSSQVALNEAIAAFNFAQGAQRKIAEERNLIVREISKLSNLSR